MKRLLAFSLIAFTLACDAALAIDLPKTPISQVLHVPHPLETYFQFKNLQEGAAFKITSGENNVTGYMTGGRAYYYLLMNQGTYNITLNDSQNSIVCSFVIHATEIPVSADNPSHHALSMRVIFSGRGYSCTPGQIQNWPNLLMIQQIC